jgi:hypothetical protein
MACGAVLDFGSHIPNRKELHSMSTTSPTATDIASVKNLVSVDKNGCIKVLDPEVLDLIAGAAGTGGFIGTHYNVDCWLLYDK